MASARLSSARRAAVLAAAVAALTVPTERLAAQDASTPVTLPGAILIVAVDTAINPIPAEIIFPGYEFSFRLTDEGAALLRNVPDGLYLVQARRLGHRPAWRFIRVTGDTTRVELVLAPADPRSGADPDDIATWRLREFLKQRPAIHAGSFLTRREIERRRPRDLVALLRRVPGLTVDRNARGPALVRSRSAPEEQCRGGVLLLVDAALPAPADPGNGDDEPSLVDGTPPPAHRRSALSHARHQDAGRRMGGPISVRGGADASADDSPPHAARPALSAMSSVPVASIAAVEVYATRDGVPPEFRVPGAECGMVLVWTAGS